MIDLSTDAATLSPIALFLAADWVVKLVMLGLVLASVWTWAIIVGFGTKLRGLRKRTDRFERLLCPRMHMKAVIVDGQTAYLGSANFTGAGLGPKSDHRRNFEAGFLTTERPVIREIMEEYDRIFLGNACTKCQLRKVCPDPIA